MSHEFYVIASYSVSALALIGLGALVILQTRKARAALDRLEADRTNRR